jgi:hypothetical protein
MLVAQAQLPLASVELPFSEGSGASSANNGDLAGTVQFVQQGGYPTFTNYVPVGPFAPPVNTSAVDMGPIVGSDGGRALDLVRDGDATLGALNAFTLCGWLNCRDLSIGPGGNRIAFALQYNNGPGLDLVHTANGALRIGVNQWPDSGTGGPLSSAGLLKADPQVGPSNWVFFAVTYDPALASGNLKYYVGSPYALASLDGSHNYNRGVIASSGPLTLANFSTTDTPARTSTGTSSRVFRGLVDELEIYSVALDLAEIQAAQLDGAPPPVPAEITRQPASITLLEGLEASFGVQVTGSAPIGYQWQTNGVDVAGAMADTFSFTPVIGDSGMTVRVRVSNSVTNFLSAPAVLTVLADNGQRVWFTFTDIANTVSNRGNLGGTGTILSNANYPVPSANVPSGAYAPAANAGSIDFGVINTGEGGRAIDLSGGLYNTGVGPMTAFTIAGWVNCRALQAGPGGNRIIAAHAFAADPGFDLVQNGDGTLQLGVNAWADYPGVGPKSGAGKITADPAAGANNWVFFAVTYDGNGASENVKYYFGSPSGAASLDVTATYSRGTFLSSGALTVGNLNPADSQRNATGSNSRCFRGLIDELTVFNRVFTLEEVQALQITAPGVARPTLRVQRAASELVIMWTSSATYQLQQRDAIDAGTWADVTAGAQVNGDTSTVRVPLEGATRFYRLESR